MATASPTPMPVYASGAHRMARHPSTRFVRRDSPPSQVSHARSTTAPQRLSDDSDDDLQPPPQLSDLGRSVLEQQQDAALLAGGSSPKARMRVGSRVRVATAHTTKTNESESNTPARDTTTPAAPSQRVRRVGLHGAPVRRGKRTPQSEEEQGPEEPQHQSQEDEHDAPHHQIAQQRHENPPEQDQENAPASIIRRPESGLRSKAKQSVIVMTDSVMKPQGEKWTVVVRDRSDKPVPLAQMSANTPHRPAPPPPPPKMSMLEAATKAAGASTTKKKVRRPVNFVLNGKAYTQMEKCGKGGSAEVFRVQAENGRMFALKKVKLNNADPVAVAGYKGEIELLKKLQDVSRVVHLLDYSIDEEKQTLYVVSEPIRLMEYCIDSIIAYGTRRG
jgi:serine/threonine-protein kinase TTK/MPS1